MTASAPVLAVRSLSKVYGSVVALDDVSFEVERNEIVGLLGPNGAGKTTTINMILGVLEPTSGTIRIEGLRSGAPPPPGAGSYQFRGRLRAPAGQSHRLSEPARLRPHLWRAQPRRSASTSLIDEFDLGALRDTKCGVLSSGEQTRVCLAKAMLNRPSLLLLDEPTASLDPADRARHPRQDPRSGGPRTQAGVLWTSHNMYEVEEVCNRVLFLSHGKILLEGDPKTLPAEHGKENARRAVHHRGARAACARSKDADALPPALRPSCCGSSICCAAARRAFCRCSPG